MTPEIRSTLPTREHHKPRQLYRHAITKEYCICIGRPGKVNSRWVSLHTTDKLEALRRLERTGVGDIIETAMDERFTDRVVDVLTKRDAMPLEKVVNEWIGDMATRVSRQSMLHPRTISSQFLRLFPTTATLDDVTVQRVNSWINTAPSLTRRQRRMSVLSGLFQFAFDRGYKKDNLGKRLGMQTHDLTFEQMERTIKDEFTREEFDQLMACEQIQGFWRWSIQLAWWLGLRMSDCCNLQWGSLCAVPGKLVVWQAKTRRRVELDLADEVMGSGAITAIIPEMRAQVTDAVYCFPEMRAYYVDGHPQRTVEQFREQCKTAGLDGEKTFHCFRKSAAMRWEAAGRSIKEIACLLGHEGTGNVQFYVETNKK